MLGNEGCRGLFGAAKSWLLTGSKKSCAFGIETLHPKTCPGFSLEMFGGFEE